MGIHCSEDKKMGKHAKIEGTRLRPIKIFAKVKSYYGTEGKYSWHYLWYYDCDCGKRIIKLKHCVGPRNKQTKSCGCYRRERGKEIMTKNIKITRNRFTSDQKTGNKRQIGSKEGHKAWNEGRICVYQYANRQMKGSRRMYITEEQLHDIHGGFKVIDWDKGEIRQTEILRGA